MLYDYLIIGSGAGGSAGAYRLAQTGRSVLLLEKGGALPRDGSTLDVRSVAQDGAFVSHELWQDGRYRPFAPQEYFNLGGKTKWYGAALLRFGGGDFAGDAARGFLPWPIAYADLEPYYEQAERLLGVRTFEAEPDLRKLLARLDGNWQQEALPLALHSDILSHPEEAKHFDGFASPLALKGDGEAVLKQTGWPGNLRIEIGRPVEELLPDEANARRIVGVRLSDGSHREARQVLLAAGALHSPRLLQRYLAGQGLDSRLPCAASVGGYYQAHLKSFLLAFSPSKKSDLLRKTTLLLNRCFPLSSVQTLGWIDGEILGSQVPRFLPGWLVRYVGQRVYGFFLQTEEGSDPRNRVVDGAPPRLDYDPRRRPEALKEHRRLVRAFRNSLLRAGYLAVSKTLSIEGTSHACGTLVAGTDPERSVVDGQGRVHGLENLYVLDGSVLPRISRVNPSLTIYAWALRVADRLARAGESP